MIKAIKTLINVSNRKYLTIDLFSSPNTFLKAISFDMSYENAVVRLI